MKRALASLALLFAVAVAQAEPLTATKQVSLRQAIDDITLAAANHDMVLVKMQPIDSALVKRGFDNPHLRILFIGSESAVRWAEAAEPRLLNLLPLRLTLIQDGETVRVITDDFSPWLNEFTEQPGRAMLLAWRSELAAVLEDFIRQ